MALDAGRTWRRCSPAMRFAPHRSRWRERIYRPARVRPRYLLVNTGNANAGTGQAGIEAARACARAMASRESVR